MVEGEGKEREKEKGSSHRHWPTMVSGCELVDDCGMGPMSQAVLLVGHRVLSSYFSNITFVPNWRSFDF